MKKFFKSILQFLVGLMAIFGIIVGCCLPAMIVFCTLRFARDFALFTNWSGCVASGPLCITIQVVGFITLLLIGLFVGVVILVAAWEIGRKIVKN